MDKPRAGFDPLHLSGLDLFTFAAALPPDDLPPGIGRLLGLSIEEVERGRIVFGTTTRPDMSNPLGQTHGGIAATLLDSCMSSAVHTTLEAGVGYATLELSVNFVRAVPADGVRLTATGTVVHEGRTTATAEGRVVDQAGRLVAHGTTTCIILRPEGLWDEGRSWEPA